MSVLKTSRKERRRMEIFARVKREEISLVKAAELLGLSYRQVLRSYRRYRKQGDAGLVHRLRGKRANRRSAAAVKKKALALYVKKYGDYGPTFAAESLAEEGVIVSVSVLRRWLLAAKLWQAKPRGARHRQWRAEKPHFGEMLQVDGSSHDWFEGRRVKACLMVFIDDATHRVYAQFHEVESTVAVMETFRGYVLRQGLPQSLYTDRHSIYETTRDATVDETLRDKPARTQFGRALQDLDVKLILARSPQAKGRVERQHRTLQDRLVKMLRQAHISTLEAANAFLESTFLPPYNQRFQVAPEQAADLHRRAPSVSRLAHVFSSQEPRVVQNDWTISWQNRHFQLTKANQKLALVNKSILVCEHLDGSLHLWFAKRELAWEELPERPRLKKPTRPPSSSKPTKPAANHPWRKPTQKPTHPGE